MGDLRFTVPAALDFDPRIWETAYITGIEGIPWHCHSQFNGEQFSIGREIDESGKLNIVWPTRQLGNVCLATTSLRIAEAPYALAVEVARGTVCRLRNQTSEWQRVGLRLPDKFYPMAEDALCQLLRALTTGNDPDKQLKHAQQSIDLALEASVLLCNTFAAQSLEARRQSEGRLSTLLGVELLPALSLSPYQDALQKTFNLVNIRADYGSVESASGKPDYEPFDRQLDWAQRANKKVCAGPLIDFRSGGLPQWMVLLDEGFESILQGACEFARATVERYRGRVHIWNAAAGLNIPSEMNWSDEEVLRMAVSLIETVRRADDRCPVLLTIDQPWSEYLRAQADGISPLHFADALIRADLGLSGLALDFNMDTWPDGSFPRDPVEVNRLIDRWSMLGLPLMVILNSPTDSQPDAPSGGDESNGDNALGDNTAGDSSDTIDRQTHAPERVSAWRTTNDRAGKITPDSILRLLLAKPSVHAIIWNKMVVDDDSSRGLWDQAGKAKPLLNSMAALRKVLLH
ncbi:MAG: hypothetical protein ABI557_13415 [Aureliella sp.]